MLCVCIMQLYVAWNAVYTSIRSVIHTYSDLHMVEEERILLPM